MAEESADEILDQAESADSILDAAESGQSADDILNAVESKPDIDIGGLVARTPIGRAGALVGEVAGEVLPKLAKVLEPLRESTVGLGGVAAGVKAAYNGEPALLAAAKSIEERKGLGREIAEEVFDPGLGQEIATVVAEMATDPLTYVSGASLARFLGRFKQAPNAVKFAEQLAEAAGGAEKIEEPLVSMIDQLADVKDLVKRARSQGVKPQTIMTESERALYEKFRTPIEESIAHRVNLRTILPDVDDAKIAARYPAPDAISPLKANQPRAMVSSEAISEADEFFDPADLHNPDLELGDLIEAQPELHERILKQKRGVVPLKASMRAGLDTPGLEPDVFAALKPGQLPKAGTLDAKMAKASLVKSAALRDMAEVGVMRANGVPLEQVAERLAMNLTRYIGSSALLSEGGRGLNAAKVASMTPRDRALAKMYRSQFKEAMLEDPKRLDAFLADMAQVAKDNIAQQVLLARKFLSPENRARAMFMELRAASLISHPLTPIRNIAGNSLAVMTNLLEAPITGAVDFMRAKVTGSKQERFVGEGVANIYGMIKGFGDAFNDSWDVFKNEASLKGFGSEFAIRDKAIPGVVGKIVRAPFRFLSATDTFFKTILYNAEMRRLAYRQAASEGAEGVARAQRIEELLRVPDSNWFLAANKEAIEKAAEFTFQSRLEGDLGKFEQFLNSNGLVSSAAKFVIPFFKTPVNIGKFVIERTPIMSELSKRGVFRQAFLHKGLNKAQVSEAIARNIVGMAATGAAYFAIKSNEGFITGAPPKDKIERDSLFGIGWRPYSIRLGDLYIPYRGFEPLSSVLAAASAFAQSKRENPDGGNHRAAYEATKIIVNNFVNQPFLRGISDIKTFLIDPESRSAQGFINAQAESLVPNIIAGTARAMDDEIKDAETPIEAMMAKLPILSKRVRNKLTRWGEPIQRTTYFMGLVDKPLPASDPIEKELRNLGIQQSVGFPQSRLGNRDLNKDEYNEYLERTGPLIKDQVKEVLFDPSWKEIHPADKRKYIEQQVRAVRASVANVMRAKVELRALGIRAKLDDEELESLDAQLVRTEEFQALKDHERRAEVNRYLADLRSVK